MKTRDFTPTNFIDLTGQRFGRLTVVCRGKDKPTATGSNQVTWLCKCDCGNSIEVRANSLRRGLTNSCGCLKDYRSDGFHKDLSGQKFGKLTAIRYIPIKDRENKRRNWLCLCECGNYTQVSGDKLISGHTKSCGCAVVEHISNVNRKYEYVSKRLYSVYKSMMNRCYNPKDREYKNYGGRGITVCDEWNSEYGYDAFSKWALNESNYDVNADRGQCTLDRVDIDKGYSPYNCRWITNKEQQNNKRTNHLIEYKGETHNVTEWAHILGFTVAKMRYHIKMGRTIQQIIDNFPNKG